MKQNTDSGRKKAGTGTAFALRALPWRRILIGAGAALAAALLLFTCLLLHLAATAPDIDEISVSPAESATYICASDGSRLRKLTLASSNRDIVTLAQIPDCLQKAVVAIEDERFYEHNGIDLRGIVRAFFTGVFRGSFSEGASTITQQLIKNNVFTEWTQENSFHERFRRKVQEQYLALQLEKRISKDEILEDYLNTINLGAGCYGVQAASRRYFGKDVSDLNVSEAAVLAAIPQNPSRYNPILHPEANRGRRGVVLDYMTAQGYLPEQEKEQALEDNVYDRIRAFDASFEEETAYSYYEDALIDQAIDALTSEKGYAPEQAYRAVYSGGLRIYTAQDSALQQICDEEFTNPENFPEGTEFGIDYALSVSDRHGRVTHYGSESLRSYIREQIDGSFDLLCASEEEARSYADAFRAHILQAAEGDSEDGQAAENAGGDDSENGQAADDAGGDGSENGQAANDTGDESNRNDPAAEGIGDDGDGNGPVTDDTGGEGSGSDQDAKGIGDDGSGSAADGLSGSGQVTVLGERLTLSPQPQASLVLIDQTTGFVRALVGGRGEKTASLTLNRATETTRQPGSTFKILTAYAPALDACGQTLATLYENEPYTYEDGTPVSNWDITDYSGTVTVREAITRSINVVAVKCITEISPRTGFDYARRLGISTLHESCESENGTSSDVIQPLALGGVTQGVTNLELCSAYAAIANGGIYHTPKFFTKILDRRGNVLIDRTGGQSKEAKTREDTVAAAASGDGAGGSYFASGMSGDDAEGDHFAAADGQTGEGAPENSSRVLSAGTAFLLTDAMRDVVSSPSGTAFGAIDAGGQPVAGKTGTTSNYKDIWFVGYTPYYTCCVWGGYDNNQALPDGSNFHSYNKTLWSAVMRRVHAGLPAADFQMPKGIIPVTLCSDSHLRAVSGGCTETYVEYFAAGTAPKEDCTLHEPAPRYPETAIYSDLLKRFRKESESESESENRSESETRPQSQTDALFPAEPDALHSDDSQETDAGPKDGSTLRAQNEPDAGIQNEGGSAANFGAQSSPGAGTTDIGSQGESSSGAASEPLPGADTGPQSEFFPAQNNTGQPDTSSFEDLMNRLTGTS